MVAPLIILCVVGAVIVLPATRIAQRLGFSPWLGVLAIFPVVNLALLWFVALADWPAVRRSS